MLVTVAALPAVVEYAEDGVSTSFAVPFRFRAATDLIVERIADGNVSPLTIGVDYTVSGGGTDAGGTVTRTAATGGATLRLRRDTTRAQAMRYPTGGRFPAESHEEALDRAMLIAQEQDAALGETAGRALMVPPGETVGDIVPVPNSALTFDAEGRPVAKPIGSFPPGPAGAANSTYASLAELKNAPLVNRTYNLAAAAGFDGGVTNGSFTYRAGDFTSLEGQNFVEHNSVPIGEGALVRNNPTINLIDLGFSPTATPSQNLAALKLGIAIAQVGSIIYAPPSAPLKYQVDTSGGLSAAAVLDKRVTFQIDGDIQAYYAVSGAPAPTPIGTNPAFILDITARGVTIAGNGRIFGDGTINDTNAGTDDTMPGLLRVAADDFTMTGIEIVSPPKIGLLLYGCYRARIDGCRWSGGPKVYNDTAYFGIRAAGGGNHIVNGNRFAPAADGGMFVQCIFLSTSHDNVVTSNQADRPFEKFVYGFGDRNTAANNNVTGNPGTIPGTNIQGTVTNVIRFHGNDNKAIGNTGSFVAGGAQLMDGSGNQAVDNIFLNCGQTGVSIYNANLSRARACGNVVTYGALVGFVAGDGIRIVAAGGPSRNLAINDNTALGFSSDDPIATIPTWQADMAYPKFSLIKPTAGNGRYYIPKTSGGRSGLAQPAWNTSPGSETVDGTITWIAVAYEGGQAGILVDGAEAGLGIMDSHIQGNRVGPNTVAGTIYGCRLGIVTRFVSYTTIALNRGAVTLRALTETNGSNNSWYLNDVQGGDLGVATLSSTSSVFGFLQGDYIPTPGSGLNATGALTITGRYEQLGRKMHVTVQLEAAGGILIPDSGSKKLCALPRGAIAAGLGVHWNFSLVQPGHTQVIPSVDGGLTLFATPIEPSDALPNGPTTIIANVEYEVAA